VDDYWGGGCAWCKGTHTRNICNSEEFTSLIDVYIMNPPSVPAGSDTFSSIVSNTILPLIDSAIGFIMVLSVLAFVYGVITFIYSSGDDQSRVAGKRAMFWGIVALFCMVSVWGLVKIIKVTFFG